MIKDQLFSSFDFATLSPEVYLRKWLNGTSQNHLENLTTMNPLV